jgi:hypothetical protein
VFYASQGNVNENLHKNKIKVRSQCFTPVILATQEAEIGRIVVRGHPRQKMLA